LYKSVEIVSLKENIATFMPRENILQRQKEGTAAEDMRRLNLNTVLLTAE